MPSSPLICPNCEQALPQSPPVRHCPTCGQETHLHPPSFGEFVHEFIGHYVALEGALWKTLGLLLFRPGQLTLAYLRGRRRRYILPLRVYISASFVFFLVVKVLAPMPTVQAEGAVQMDAQSRAEMQLCADGPDCGEFERWVSRFVLRIHERAGGGADVFQSVRDRLVAGAPYAMFALQPVFAALVMVAWRRRRLAYGVHFVFSLHLHAFWFLALLALATLPDGPAQVVPPVLLLYTLRALHTVYGGRWWATTLRGLLLMAVYTVLIGVLLVAGGLYALSR
ncbi:MAG: DUF3667 domain-containing protein [Rubrivivax sp.]|nr:DUF3667 domain-containing protein [Rubrivivax sp.]